MPRKIFVSALCVVASMLLAVICSGPAAAGGDELFVTRGGVSYILERAVDGAPERYESRDGKALFTSDEASASLTINGENISRYIMSRDDGDGLIVTADGVNYRMNQVVTASGAKYEVQGDPDTFFWSKGAAASLCIGGKYYEGYGIWYPSGGIWLPDEGMPTGVEWRAMSIDGADVIDGSNVTLTFDADGRLHGVASVNNYFAQWMNVGNRVILTRPASTRKMGSEELMNQEAAFLRVLSDVAWYRMVRDGIELIGKSGGSLVLTR